MRSAFRQKILRLTLALAAILDLLSDRERWQACASEILDPKKKLRDKPMESKEDNESPESAEERVILFGQLQIQRHIVVRRFLKICSHQESRLTRHWEACQMDSPNLLHQE